MNAMMFAGIAVFLEPGEKSKYYSYYFWIRKTREKYNHIYRSTQINLNLIGDHDEPYCSFDEQPLHCSNNRKLIQRRG